MPAAIIRQSELAANQVKAAATVGNIYYSSQRRKEERELASTGVGRSVGVAVGARKSSHGRMAGRRRERES